MNVQKYTQNEEKYDINCLMFLDPCKKRLLFFCFVIIYRIVAFSLLLALVYNSGNSKSDNSNKNDYNITCLLKGCSKCTGTNTSNECNSCFEGLEPIYKDNKIIECHNQSRDSFEWLGEI